MNVVHWRTDFLAPRLDRMRPRTVRLRPVCWTVLSPEVPDFRSLDFGPLVARFERGFDLPGVEQVHAGRRAGDDEHAFGAGGSQVLHLVVDIVGDAAEQRALIAVG